MSTLDSLVLAATLATAFAIVLVLFLRRPLHLLLVELCGNEVRARFWLVYWTLIIVLVALYGLLSSAPLEETRRWTEDPAAPLVLTGIRASLFAVLFVLGVLGLVLLWSIARRDGDRTSPKAHITQG